MEASEDNEEYIFIEVLISEDRKAWKSRSIASLDKSYVWETFLLFKVAICFYVAFAAFFKSAEVDESRKTTDFWFRAK
ncbi:hypothetical protein BOTCAL_0307g00100 [Botryotinia calthae]|uniref:Uncharacterized protein n=1 Tax=Botryotinia calthae TaxID=38488 RepID=A0A4Y8CU54_9HELO|nr:hypothetical protein BOTCAL_0307g00100 [Botryotinia calthae]